MSQHWLKPSWEPFLSFPELPIQHLLDRNIKALIIDADKTLLANKETIPPKPVKDWIKKANKLFKMHILSNNPSKKRISTIANSLNLPYTYLASKPRSYSLKKVISNMSINRNEIALIGDRIFTDILAGNKLGLYTILVTPIDHNGSKAYSNKTQKVEKLLSRFLGVKS